MEKLQPIQLNQGATTIVELDLTDFELQGGSIVFTMRGINKGWGLVKTWEFTEQQVNTIIFEDEFTARLEPGRFNYEYDLMWHLDGERFAQCAPTPVEVSRTVGGYDGAGH